MADPLVPAPDGPAINPLRLCALADAIWEHPKSFGSKVLLAQAGQDELYLAERFVARVEWNPVRAARKGGL